MGSEKVPGTPCAAGEHHEWPGKGRSYLSRQQENFFESHGCHFEGDKTKGSINLIKPVFPIVITQPRVPGIASNFLTLFLICISTNARKPILRFCFRCLRNSPPRFFRALSVRIWRAASPISHVRWRWREVDVPYLTTKVVVPRSIELIEVINPVIRLSSARCAVTVTL